MADHVIPYDSTSYPTLAVILHHGVTDGEQKTAIYMLSWRMYQFLFHMGNAGLHPSQDQREGPEGCWFWYERLRDLLDDGSGRAGSDRLDDIIGALVVNQNRSIEKIKEMKSA